MEVFIMPGSTSPNLGSANVMEQLGPITYKIQTKG